MSYYPKQKAQTLTVDLIEKNIGAEINWFTPKEIGSTAYYHGRCKLKGIEVSKEIDPETKTPYTRPVVDHISGDWLGDAWRYRNYFKIGVEFGTVLFYFK
jgi:hypothetical protein